jgi:ADP-ribose pyrophosphatase YjhB (NUDIX family)
MPFVPRGPLPQAEYEAVYAQVPRLTVEVVIASEAGLLLTRRETGPCRGLWHIPGGTVRFGEPLTAAVTRVAQQELGLEATAGALLGYIEYPSHLERALDWPVGMAFRTELAPSAVGKPFARPEVTGWFSQLPDEMHDEQRAFLRAHDLAT